MAIDAITLCHMSSLAIIVPNGNLRPMALRLRLSPGLPVVFCSYPIYSGLNGKILPLARSSNLIEKSPI